MPEMQIGAKILKPSSMYVVAEIGHNHMGKIGEALKLIDAAQEAGADAVKFQKRDNETVYTKKYLDREYIGRNSYGPTYGEHREFLEFSGLQYDQIAKHCSGIGMDWFVTVFDENSVDFMEAFYNPPCYKVASGDLNNTPLLDHIMETGKPMILSTGGASYADIDRTNSHIKGYSAAFLHCVSMYSRGTPAERCNLNAIPVMRARYERRLIGFSCHYNGPLAAVLAGFLGACIIEKHFTLNHANPGSDHALSLQPEGFRKMVRDLGRCKVMRGSGEKIPSEEEDRELEKMAKSLYPARHLSKGYILQEVDLIAKSPTAPGAFPPYMKYDLVGRSICHDLSTGIAIGPDDIWGDV